MGMMIVSVFTLGLRWVSGMPLWACFVVSLFAILINGWLATWEDDRPGGFNNPRDHKPRDPNT